MNPARSNDNDNQPSECLQRVELPQLQQLHGLERTTFFQAASPTTLRKVSSRSRVADSAHAASQFSSLWRQRAARELRT